MNYKNIFLLIVLIILSTGCGGNIANKKASTATPDFLTATLPPTLTQGAAQAMQTSTLAVIFPGTVNESNISPVEGTTLTQVNVRSEPSTASEPLGMLGPFVKVLVIGKDASGSWYQIMYAESNSGKGWVRAEYAQVNTPEEIPLVETSADSGSGVSGLVIQKINVRNGPGTDYELLGVLNSNDVVFITGKDADGAWMQIKFANVPDGKGWVTAEFLQVGNIENIPIIGNSTGETAAPTDAISTPHAIIATAIQDGDTMQAPLAVTVFSQIGSRALQINGDVSAPDGDAEDWIQLTTNSKVIAIQVMCSSDTLRVELWNNEKPVDDLLPGCGERSFVNVTPSSDYFLRLSESNANEPRYTNYILSVKDIH